MSTPWTSGVRGATRLGSLQRTPRTDRSPQQAPVNHPGELDAASVVELGEDAVEASGPRWRTRRYSSTHILAQDAQERMDTLMRMTVDAPPREPEEALDLATSLFDDPSDVFAALDELAQREELAPFADVISQAQEYLTSVLSPRWIIAGLDVALQAKECAAITGVPAVDLRGECRRLIASTDEVHAVFEDWIRTFDERRRRVIVQFVSEEGEAIVWTCGWGGSSWELDGLRLRLQVLRRLSGSEQAFVVPLRALAARRMVRFVVHADAALALLFIGVVSGELTADAILEWLDALGIDGLSPRAIMAAALLRAIKTIAHDVFVDMSSRSTLVERLETVIDEWSDRERAALRGCIRTGCV
jgi:hypothetical protein